MAILLLESGQVLKINDRFLRLTGLSEEQVLGSDALALLPYTEGGQEVSFSEIVARDDIQSFETRITEGESSRRLRLSVERMKTGNREVVLVRAWEEPGESDIEQQLWEAEHKYRMLVEQVPAVTYIDAVSESDPKDLLPIYISPQIQDLLGYSPAEWLADPDLWTRAVHPDDLKAVSAEGDSRFSRGEPFLVEYRMVARNGRIVWVKEGSLLVRDDKGRPKFWQGIYVDITKHKASEQALEEALQREREAAERLRQLDQLKTAFLHAVSHDLRTPLTAVLGLAATLQRPDLSLSSDNVRDLATRIWGKARKLDRLLGDLLDLDRLDRGIVEPQRTPTDIGGLIRTVVREFEGLKDRTVTVDAEPVVAEVDGPMVERIVENLVANAIRHTPSVSEIWVRMERNEEGVLIAVEDDGPGVPDPLKEAIFEPFYRGEDGASYLPGTGIGLSLVARFAEIHGGRAWVEDRRGGGASFRVLLAATGSVTLA